MRSTWLISISSLKEGQNRIETELASEALNIEPATPCDITLVRPVLCRFDLFRQADRLYLSGTVSFHGRLTCAVCAEDFEQDREEEIYVEFEQRSNRQEPPGVHELDGDELVRVAYEGGEIDLIPVVRDTILLSIPIAPTCRSDCKGICPECGANLNTGECSCAPAVSIVH